jgi:hypothetical protein
MTWDFVERCALVRYAFIRINTRISTSQGQGDGHDDNEIEVV